jgi:hypothetical protein
MTQTQPALFVPHGAPTFALRPGAAGAAMAAKALPAAAPPRAIVIVSAHWDTAVPTVGFADRLETIHDFWASRTNCTPALPGHRLPRGCRAGRRRHPRPACRSNG